MSEWIVESKEKERRQKKNANRKNKKEGRRSKVL